MREYSQNNYFWYLFPIPLGWGGRVFYFFAVTVVDEEPFVSV